MAIQGQTAYLTGRGACHACDVRSDLVEFCAKHELNPAAMDKVGDLKTDISQF